MKVKSLKYGKYYMGYQPESDMLKEKYTLIVHDQ